MECKRPYAREMRRFVCAFRLRTYGVRSVNPALCAFYVNELSSPMDVKRADVQLHLRKFLLSPNMFISIAVVPHKPIVHHPNAYRLVDNHVRDDYTL